MCMCTVYTCLATIWQSSVDMLTLISILPYIYTYNMLISSNHIQIQPIHILWYGDLPTLLQTSFFIYINYKLNIGSIVIFFGFYFVTVPLALIVA